MKEMQILSALGNIGDGYILEAAMPKRASKKKLIFLVAAILALLLSTTAAAVSMDWPAALAEYFSLEPRHEAAMVAASDAPAAAAEGNGLQIEVTQTLVSGQSIYVLYEVTVPEGSELPDQILWEFEQWSLPTAESDSPRLETGGSRLLGREENKLTMLFHGETNAPLQEGPIELYLQNLSTWHYDEALHYGWPEPVFEGKWTLEWQLTFDTSGIVISPNEKLGDEAHSVVEEISLTPIELYVRMVSVDERGEVSRALVFSDGSEMPVQDQKHAAVFRQKTGDWEHSYSYTFDTPVDTETVTGIKIGGVFIPFE